MRFYGESLFLGQKCGFRGVQLDTWLVENFDENLHNPLSDKCLSAKGGKFKNGYFFALFEQKCSRFEQKSTEI